MAIEKNSAACRTGLARFAVRCSNVSNGIDTSISNNNHHRRRLFQSSCSNCRTSERARASGIHKSSCPLCANGPIIIIIIIIIIIKLEFSWCRCYWGSNCCFLEPLLSVQEHRRLFGLVGATLWTVASNMAQFEVVGVEVLAVFLFFFPISCSH